MRWNVFSLETVKTALEPKFVLEKIRYVTDDEEYGEGKSTRFVFRNVEEMPEIDHIDSGHLCSLQRQKHQADAPLAG